MSACFILTPHRHRHFFTVSHHHIKPCHISTYTATSTYTTTSTCTTTSYQTTTQSHHHITTTTASNNTIASPQLQIRKEYFEDATTSGPQSSVLEGITWDEVRKIKAGGPGAGGDGVLVTAASRGIIQRDHQKDALFYKNYTLGNPFEHVTDHDLEKYMQDVGKPKK